MSGGFFSPTIPKSIKTVAISVSSSGDNTIVAAVPGKRIKVIAFMIQSVGTSNLVKWKDGSGTDLTGALSFNIREGVSAAAPLPSWLFATAAGNALVLNLGSASAMAGFVTYFDDDN